MSRRSGPSPGERASVRPGDAGVALATGGLAMAAVLVGGGFPEQASVWVYALIAATSAPLVFRRRWPVEVVCLVSLLTLAYFILDFPAAPATLVMLVALYGVAAAGHRWWTVAVVTLFAGGGLLFRLFVEGGELLDIALDSGLYVLVSLLGDAIHSRRQLRSEVQERLRRAAMERKAETERQVTAERLRIARELHDVMAHTVTTMSVQAAAARDLIGTDVAAARSALDSARSAARHAMGELRATVAVLRSQEGEEPPLVPSPRLDEIKALADVARHSGVAVQFNMHGEPRPLGGAVELTVFRIVQEGLTNVVRHAGADNVKIDIQMRADEVSVRVDDDGRGPGLYLERGHGLHGLQERVQALEGTLHVGPSPAGGFRIRAEIPTRDAR